MTNYPSHQENYYRNTKDLMMAGYDGHDKMMLPLYLWNSDAFLILLQGFHFSHNASLHCPFNDLYQLWNSVHTRNPTIKQTVFSTALNMADDSPRHWLKTVFSCLEKPCPQPFSKQMKIIAHSLLLPTLYCILGRQVLCALNITTKLTFSYSNTYNTPHLLTLQQITLQ